MMIKKVPTSEAPITIATNSPQFDSAELNFELNDRKIIPVVSLMGTGIPIQVKMTEELPTNYIPREAGVGIRDLFVEAISSEDDMTKMVCLALAAVLANARATVTKTNSPNEFHIKLEIVEAGGSIFSTRRIFTVK